jgi:hypothetical protein
LVTICDELASHSFQLVTKRHRLTDVTPADFQSVTIRHQLADFVSVKNSEVVFHGYAIWWN